MSDSTDRHPTDRPDVVWIDGVGGLALATGDQWTIGRDANLSIIANLPSVAGTLKRRGEDWFWIAGGPNASGNSPERLIADGDEIPLTSGRTGQRDGGNNTGPSVRCVMRRPSGLNATRRLELSRPHRWAGGVDVVLLISKIATIGPTPSDTVCAPHLDQTHFLSAMSDPMTIRCQGPAMEMELEKPVSAGSLTMMVRPWDV